MPIGRKAGIVLDAVLLAALIVLPRYRFRSGKTLHPQPGTPVRKAVLDGLREWVLENHDVRVVFVVRYLKVPDGWAWTETLPQSPNGARKYEGLMALIRRTGEGWKVMHVPSGEEDAPPVDGTYFEMLLEEVSEVPGGIFPRERKVN